MEEKTIYVIQEGDNHLSADSLVIMGFFDDEDKLRDGARQLIRERIDDNFWDYEYDENECSKEDAKNDFIEEQFEALMNEHQTNAGDVLFMITEATLNKIEEF